MKRFLALLLILFCLPMTKTQLIRRIRCQNPEYSYEQLCAMSQQQLRDLLWPGV